MKYYEQSFKEGEFEFRFIKLRPAELSAIISRSLKDDLESDETVVDFALEHCTVLVNDKSLPVKEKGKEIYYPAVIADDIELVQSIVNHFFNDVIKPFFQKSNESNQKQQ